MTAPAFVDELDVLTEHDHEPDVLTPAQRRALLALTALLAAGVDARRLDAQATALLVPLGIPAPAVHAAVRLSAGRPAHGVPRGVALLGAVTRPGARRSASSLAVAAEPAQRARYLLAAAERLTGSLVPTGDGSTAFSRFADQLTAEKRYRQQHLDAQGRRLDAATAVDRATAEHGPVLGWHTVMDERTTPDCAALDGTNFRADSEPAGGWPGARHGGTCRCSAGEPHTDPQESA